MSFDVHPILDAGHTPAKDTWYAIAPEGSASSGISSGSNGPCPRVGACANFYQLGDLEEIGTVCISAGATPEGPYSDLHQLVFKKDCIEWSSLPSEELPARYEHASCIVPSLEKGASNLFIFAGAKPNGPVSDSWKYNFNDNKWQEIITSGCIPIPRTYHSSSSMVPESQSIVVYSGGDTGTDPVADQKVYILNPKSGEWHAPVTLGSPPSPRQGHVAAVVGSKFFIHGGMAGEEILEDLHCLNLDDMRWSCPKVTGTPPPPLAAHGVAVIRTSLYIFGGLSPEGTTPGAQDSLYCLHTDTLVWERVMIKGAAPPARLDHAMCSIRVPIPCNHTKNLHNLATTVDDGLKTKVETPSNFVSSGEDTSTNATDCRQKEEGHFGDGGSDKKSFQAITIIDPSGKDFPTSKPSTVDCDEINNTAGKFLQDSDSEETCELVSALFIFGGMDTSGNIHGDSFVLFPYNDDTV